MKKLILFIIGLAFAGLAFGDFQPMDGTIQHAYTGNPINFAMSYYQREEVPSMKYYIKPFHCKIWTDYVGDVGFGVKFQIGNGYARLEGTYPRGDELVITKDNPLFYYANFGIVTSLYNSKPYIFIVNEGCSPFDSHCKSNTYPTIYESCDLTLT